MVSGMRADKTNDLSAQPIIVIYQYCGSFIDDV
jgi:hypothetical protein